MNSVYAVCAKSGGSLAKGGEALSKSRIEEEFPQKAYISFWKPTSVL
jgi:hypothetical protein